MSTTTPPATSDAPDLRTGWSLTLTRTFDAPAALVFDAWTRPEHLLRWYCPRDFTVLSAECDPRPGGRWRSAMRSPEGDEFVHHGVYREVTPPRRLVFTHAWEKNHLEPVADTLITIDFVERDGRTTMTFTHAGFATEASRDSHEGGWSEAFDNLAAALASDREVRFARTFDAPRALLFDAFTRPEMIRRWLFGPDEWPLVECRVDPRVGGRLRYVWRHVTTGKEMAVNGMFREVTPPQRLVHTELFEEDWTGGETVVTTTFEERDGRTTVTLAIVYSSRQARDAALATGMSEGMSRCFARLDVLIAAER